jgi:hypothetical protein
MADKSKCAHKSDKPNAGGNVSSSGAPEQSRPWTDEEMAAAKPIPLPTGDTAPTVSISGVPHTGKGKTKPAGRPEDDEKSRG